MNYTNFIDAPIGFPVESDSTFGFMQSDYQSAIKGLAAIVGSNRLIVSGCEDDGIDVEDGWIWIDGDLVKFQGGAKEEFIIIESTVVQKANQNGQLYDRYTTKVAKFGTGAGQLAYSIFDRVTSLENLLSAIKHVARGSLFEGQDWVILDGLKPNEDNTEILGGMAIHKGNLVIAEGYEFGVGSENNPRYLMPDGKWSLDYNDNYLEFTPYTTQRSENLRRKYESRRGTIYWFVSTQFPALFFDGTGLGKYEWDGWAKANGENQTFDLSSAVPGLTAIQRL